MTPQATTIWGFPNIGGDGYSALLVFSSRGLLDEGSQDETSLCSLRVLCKRLNLKTLNPEP